MPKTNWTEYALKVAALRMDESICFAELDRDLASMNRFRVGLAQNPHSKVVRIRVRATFKGITVTRFAGCRPRTKESVLRRSKLDVVPVEPIRREADVSIEIRTSCAEKACPFPPGTSGLCQQHEYWFSQATSPIGSSLSGTSLEGA